MQRFLRSLNYVSDFYKNFTFDRKILTDRIERTSSEWTTQHTEAVKKIKEKVKILSCLNIVDINAFKIVESNASRQRL